jgi:hypothetical protein
VGGVILFGFGRPEREKFARRVDVFRDMVLFVSGSFLWYSIVL